MYSSLESIKNEYQHCISTTNGSIFIDISIFWGARFKKASVAVGKWDQFQFLGKNLTPKQVEIPKLP